MHKQTFGSSVRSTSTAQRRTLRNGALGVTAMIATACASSSGLFSVGPKPRELAGVWIDSAKTTALDTLAWVLGSNGDDGTLHLTVKRDPQGMPIVQSEEKRYGFWYLEGNLSDTTGRAFCVKPRARNGGTCTRFRMDTLNTLPVRRRLVMINYRGAHHTADRVLLERLP